LRQQKQEEKDLQRRQQQQNKDADYAARQLLRRQREEERDALRQQREEEKETRRQQRENAKLKREVERALAAEIVADERKQKEEERKKKKAEREVLTTRRKFIASLPRAKLVKPTQPRDSMDDLLKGVASVRGSLGGILGPLAGVVLDLVAFMRRGAGGTAGAPSPGSPFTPPSTTGQGIASGWGGSVPGGIQGTSGGVQGVARPPGSLPGWTGMQASQIAPGSISGGMMAGIARALPIAGIALAAKAAVDGAIKGVISGIGGAMTGVATTGDPAHKTITQLSDGISKLGEKIPGIGAAMVVVGEVGKVIGGLMETFTRTAERYGEYNPQIAQQLAMAEIREVMGDMRRAQRSGPELARFIQAQSKMQQQFEEIKMRIWMKILPILTAIMQVFSRLLGIAENQDVAGMDDPTTMLLTDQVRVPQL
jgi:molecular chaperone GrpE (heat shock protein)